MANPWTQRLEMRWRPALSFYERRIQILRSLDERKILRAFKVGDGHINARILDARHELMVTQSSLTLDLFGQDAAVEQVWECVSLAIGEIKPTGMDGAFAFQHLVPLDMEFEAAVARGRERLMAMPEGTPIQDWALLISPSDTSSVEFGIVRDREVADRLTRRVGRMRQGGDLVGAGRYVGVQFPEVAIFADSHWGDPQDKELDADDIRDRWREASDRAGALIDDLYAKMTKQD